MKAPRTAAGLVLLGLFGVALGTWAVHEARRQRGEFETALRGEAALLAESLAPGLAAASDALREIDEVVAARLLDEARLLAELARESDPTPERLAAIAEANEVETIAYLDPDGRVRLQVGGPLEADEAESLRALLAGRVDEVLLAPAGDGSTDHRAAAVALARGGAVLVRIETASAYAFARRLGVGNLLRRLVRSGRVLYLEYREEPGGVAAWASWDGGPLPSPPSEPREVGQVRDRVSFEVSMPVETPAGGLATLRVGLDGAAIERASLSAARRTALVGVVLAGFGLASAAFALVRRDRDRERAAAARRLAEAEEARRRSERLAAAGALTAGLAHEVRSPLNAISLAAQGLERRHADDDARQLARLVRAEVGRLDGVLREFLELARPVSDRRETVPLESIAAEVAELLSAEAAEAGVEIARVAGGAEALIERDGVRRAVINLVRNAIQASPAGGVVRIDVARVGDSRARLRVLDEGRGPDPRLGATLLEPFVTTRAGGTGLGLALVQRVADEHGGAFRLESRAPSGAEATLWLPLAPMR